MNKSVLISVAAIAYNMWWDTTNPELNCVEWIDTEARKQRDRNWNQETC